MDKTRKHNLDHVVLLAAGLGQRMRPITEILPKPMLPIVDQPLIKYNIEHYRHQGFTRIGINLHHKYDIIAKYLTRFDDVFVVVEDLLRGTGGALHGFKNFAPANFLIHSCDVISDLDIARLIDAHIRRGAAATLALREYEGANTIALDRDFGIRSMIGQADEASYDYAGTAVLSDCVFAYLPDKTEFSMVEVWNRMIDQGEKVIGLPGAMTWYNVNTPHAYWRLHYDLLLNGLELNRHKFGSAVYIDPASQVKTTRLNGFVCVGPNCTISENISLTNTIVFQDSHVMEGEYTDCLLSDAFCIEMMSEGEEKKWNTKSLKK